MPLRSFCREFRAESSHGEPDRARDNFQKNAIIFANIFLQKSTFYKINQAQNQDENDRNWIL